MRNRYLDTLRAAAIVRVVVYHHFGWAWLSLAFPAMGVMFAVAGSLTAASLAKRSAGSVVTSRVRRLLPPVWLLGLVTVPVMLRFGWTAETDGQHPFDLPSLGFWLLPLGDPPGSDKAAFVWDALWYVRTYLWLVLLSPLLHPLYKRVGWPLLAAPLLGMALLERGDFGMPSSVESALWDLATYGSCWLAGFAHRDGRLRRMSPALTVAVAAALAGLGLYWLVQGHAETGWDLNEASEAQAVYSLAAVLLLLRWEPSTARMAGTRLASLVSGLNARAVTIYLWHGVAIAAAWPVLERTGLDDVGAMEDPVTLGVTVALTAVAVAVFGWAEDLAARRRPRLWPSTGDDARPDPVTTAPPAPVAAFGPAPAGWPEIPRTQGPPAQVPRADGPGTPVPRVAGPAPQVPLAGSPAADVTRVGGPPADVIRAEGPRAGAHRAAGGEDREAITRRLTLRQGPGDMPVAGRPPAPAPDNLGGLPWAGHTAPRQSGPSHQSGPGHQGGPDHGHPLPVRFDGRDGAP